jgi:hypothetical protein
LPVPLSFSTCSGQHHEHHRQLKRRSRRHASYAARLNAPQKEAVLATEGPVLMLAGAGTGKTAALTARLAHLVATRRAYPSQILCVTFTNKAAREMRERVAIISGRGAEGMPWLGTFHSICAKMLRRHAELVGLQSNYTIIDTDDQLRLLKQLIRGDLDEKRWPARQLAGLIDRWKNRGLNPADLDAVENEAYANGKRPALYARYQDRLKALNACDFGDLMLHMLNILRQHPDILPITSAASNTSWWTNIRTPTRSSICGCGCWRRSTRTSAWWAMMTSRSIHGAGQKWPISCGSKRIFRARK